jgi:hypothetical protein
MRKVVFILAVIAIHSTVFAKGTIPAGIYMELYYGAKSGGGSEHHVLVAELKKDDALQGFEFFCINGRSRSADSNVPGYAIDRERRLPPNLAKNCKGSAAVLMGPVQGENIEQLEKHLDSNYMHLYSELRIVP